MRIRELRRKEVINITDGGRLGFVGDVDLRMPDGQTAALIVYGPARFFGLFGRGEEYYVPWDSIQRIGDDIILIDKPAQHRDPALERAGGKNSDKKQLNVEFSEKRRKFHVFFGNNSCNPFYVVL